MILCTQRNNLVIARFDVLILHGYPYKCIFAKSDELHSSVFILSF